MAIPVLKQHTAVELAHLTYEAHRLGLLLAGKDPDITNQEEE